VKNNKSKFLIVCVLALVVLGGCAKSTNSNTPPPPTTTIDQHGRDVAAALNGAITSAEAQYGASCGKNPSQAACTAIGKGVSAQNALITAIQSYCGWSATTPPSNPQAPCVAVSGAAGILNTAITNAATVISEIESLAK